MGSRSTPEAPVGTMRWGHIEKPIFRLVMCVLAVFAVTALLYEVTLLDRPLSAALGFLFVVLIVAAAWGFRYALFVSLLSALGFTWLLPPVGRFSLSDPRDMYVLAAFLVIGITTSRLSDRARVETKNANQRRAEAVVAQHRFADLVNSVEGIVWEADAQTLVFTFVSEQAEHILGYRPEQWLREPTFWKDHLHPEDRDRAVQLCAQATAEKRSHDFEYRMIAADGRVVWLRDLVTVVVENGRATQLRGAMIDISKRRQTEETLREQANLLSLTHDAIFVRNLSSTIKFWNRGAEEMYGWTAEEASGKVSHQFLKTVFPEPLEQIEAELMRAGRWEGELVHTRKDGTPLVVASRWSLQRDNQGTPAAILENNNDITEQKRAEQARQEIEEQWRAAFESNPTMYFIVDAGGLIVSVNAFGAEQLGFTVSELAGKPVLNVFYEPDKQEIQQHAKDCFEQPGRMMGWEARKIRKDGSMLWVREKAKVVVLRNRPVLLVVCEDITEQKRAEDAARRGEKELRDLIENVPAMVFMALPGPSNAFVSRGWREYTGVSAAETSGSGWQSVVHPEDMERHMGKWRVCSASGQPYEDEARFRRASDGEYRWFLVRAVPLHDDRGNILKWYGILTDIEDRKRAEALLTGEKRILEMVAKGDSLAQILDSLCRLVEEQATGVLASVLLVEGNRLRHGSAPSLPRAYTAAIDGVVIGPSVGSCGTAAFRGEQVIVENIETDSLWADYREAALPHSLRACWSTPLFSSQGKVIGTFAMYYREPRRPNARDQAIIEQITHLAGVAIERKLTQEALRTSEAYLAEAQRLSHIGSWAGNLLTQRVFHSSEEHVRLYGFDRREGVPTFQDFYKRIHPEDEPTVRTRIESAIHSRADFEIEFRLALPDGTIRHLYTIGHPDASGEPGEYSGISVDVTERKRTEEELRSAETRFRTFVDHATDALFVHSAKEGKIVDVNRQACESLGYTREEMIGMKPNDFDSRAADPAFDQWVRKRIEADEICTFEAAHRRKDGTVFPVEVRIRLFWHAGLPFGLSLARDITGRKRAEQERERLRQVEADLAHINRVSMMGELAASLAHEIKQPIAAAATNAGTCLRWLHRQPPDIEEARETAARIVNDVNRAADIINRVRSLYTKEGEQRELVNVNGMIAEMITLLRNEATRHSILIRSDLAQNVPKVIADPVQLQQVLMNLMLNGIEAMKDKKGELTVKSERTADDQVLISVSDSGVGLPREKAEQIFDAFFTTKPQGTDRQCRSRRNISFHSAG